MNTKKLVAPVLLAPAVASLAACTDQPATIPPSGVTSSNGGGQRSIGNLPEVDVTNGRASVGTMPRNPRVPVY